MKISQLRHTGMSASLRIDEWNIMPGQHWGVFATHSHTSALLVSVLSQSQTPEQGTICEPPERIGCVSLQEQQKLLDIELARDETDFLDQIDYGTSVEGLILEAGCRADELEGLLEQTDLTELRLRGFRQLSTGETRRLMLARALATHPHMLILDEPYTGLDTHHRHQLSALLAELSLHMTLMIVTSREDELSDFISHIAVFDEQALSQTMTRAQWFENPLLEQMKALSADRSEALVALMNAAPSDDRYPNPRVIMRDVAVEYVDAPIFSGVNWEINAGQHWQVRGPNGCGKSTLLGLILGDHPQCYSNDITVLGMKRGRGETIWDVKKHIGLVSSALHLQYRVDCSALDVLCSGFYDSIGLYQKPSAKEVQLAQQWLALLEMSEMAKASFRSLDYGRQRLLLIGRALIKQPALLVLDEPYQGLDYLSRKLVFHALNRIAMLQITQLIYVTHYEEDALPAIHHFVDFIANEDSSGYHVDIYQA
ncbi:ATP-binding cassette domain-containing protein [Vibrio zhugei]|uniref:ATP-binding cassette domain-containing protein n=1 Tax=Vibrio zhugei TaxID=2479546 RepID=A0ABV7C6P5_9VIBR|nr:ATP-binding cassette domain-containing protein [Vibrio zhugei]